MIDSDTKVTLTMKQIMWGIVALVCSGGAVLWAVLTFTIGGMRDDVKAIRAQTQTLQTADKDSAVRIREGENKLAEQIGALRTDIVGLSGKLDAVNSSVNTLSNQLQDVRKQVIAKYSSFDDPNFTTAFASRISDVLKQKGFDKSNIVIVPLSDSTPK